MRAVTRREKRNASCSAATVSNVRFASGDLLDLALPDASGGLDALRRVRAAAVPVVAPTALLCESSIGRCPGGACR
jgi:hypothetical protein